MATRKVTNQLLELIEEGVLDAETVLKACLSYMSEADVAEVALFQGWVELVRP